VSVLFHAIGFGLVTSLIVALSAVAFSMQYAVTRIPNFAHGDLLTVAAYATLQGQRLGATLALAAVFGAIAAGLLAFAINRAVLAPFVKRNPRLIFMVAVTAGLSLIIQYSLALIFGNDNVVLSVPDLSAHEFGPFLWTYLDVLIVFGGLAVLVAIHLVLRYTPFGRAQRAVADNADLARASAIRTGRVIALTWLLAGTVAGCAGLALATRGGTFGPLLGANFLLITLSAAVIGGIGRVYGALIGALAVGLVTELSGAYLSAGYKQVAALLVLVLVLLVRPNGILTVYRGATQQ
jgi:branched-subunit amino acid ABC-type transport system permease component